MHTFHSVAQCEYTLLRFTPPISHYKYHHMALTPTKQLSLFDEDRNMV
jgi:hypothetical protein